MCPLALALARRPCCSRQHPAAARRGLRAAAVIAEASAWQGRAPLPWQMPPWALALQCWCGPRHSPRWPPALPGGLRLELAAPGLLGQPDRPTRQRAAALGCLSLCPLPCCRISAGQHGPQARMGAKEAACAPPRGPPLPERASRQGPSSLLQAPVCVRGLVVAILPCPGARGIEPNGGEDTPRCSLAPRGLSRLGTGCKGSPRDRPALAGTGRGRGLGHL